MANEFLGDLTLVKVDTLGGGVYNALANQLSATFDTTTDIIETTNKSSSQKKTYLPGNFGGIVTVNGLIDSQAAGDTDGWIVLQLAQFAGNKIDMQLFESGTADTFTGTGVIASMGRGYDQNGAQTYAATINFDGEITPA